LIESDQEQGESDGRVIFNTIDSIQWYFVVHELCLSIRGNKPNLILKILSLSVVVMRRISKWQRSI